MNESEREKVCCECTFLLEYVKKYINQKSHIEKGNNLNDVNCKTCCRLFNCIIKLIVSIIRSRDAAAIVEKNSCVAV